MSCEIEMLQAIFNQIDALFFQYLKQNLTFVVISFSHFAYCQIVRETISGTKCVKKGQSVIPISSNWRNNALISLKFIISEKATEIAHFGFDRPEYPPFENLKLEHNKFVLGLECLCQLIYSLCDNFVNKIRPEFFCVIS